MLFKDQRRRRKARDRTSQTVSIAAAEACYPANQRYAAGSQSSIDVQRKEDFWLKYFHFSHMHQLHMHINIQHKGGCECINIKQSQTLSTCLAV